MISVNVKKQVVLSMLAITLILGTLFIPVSVSSYDELESVSLGYPLAFISQDFSRYDPEVYPQSFNFGSPWEDPFRIMWEGLFLSYLIVVSFLNVILIFLVSLKRGRSR